MRLAAPVLVEQLFLMMVWFSDRLLTGHYLETAHLAAITLMAYLLWMITSLFSVVAIAATAMVARFVGSGDPESARRVTNQSFVLGTAIAVFATVLGLWIGPSFVRFLHLDGHAAVLAERYLQMVVAVLPFVMIQVVGIACLRGAGDMISGLVVMAIVNVVNVVVSWLLVLGPGPLPRLGWLGIAIGTTTGFVVGGTLVLILLAVGRAGLSLQLRRLRADCCTWIRPGLGWVKLVSATGTRRARGRARSHCTLSGPWTRRGRHGSSTSRMNWPTTCPVSTRNGYGRSAWC